MQKCILYYIYLISSEKKIQELGRIFKNFLIKFHVFLSIYLYNTI